MMNINDLDFQDNVGESRQISGGQSNIDNALNTIKQQFQSLTGQVVGTFNAVSDVTAIGTSEANISVLSNVTGEAVNKVSIGYGTTTTAFATTPGT